MARLAIAFCTGMLMAACCTGQAADNPAAGVWKFSFVVPAESGPAPIGFLVMLSDTDKGWVGDFLGASKKLVKEPVFEKVAIKEDAVKFTMKFGAGLLTFDGRISKDGKKIPGSFDLGGQTQLVEMIPSKLKTLTNEFAAARENLETLEGGQEFFDAYFTILAKSAAEKMKPEEVRTLTDRAAKIAEKYGPRWERIIALRTAGLLVEQEPFTAIALEQGRRAERMLKPEDDLPLQMEVLDSLVQLLKKARKLDELKPLETRLLKMETRDYADYLKANPIKVEEFKGRKGKSDRTVLVELFTGTEAEPCVPMQLAVDALMNAYKPSEVVFLKYHVPFGGLDPFSLREGIDRLRSYPKEKQPAPGVFIEGKRDDAGGGPRGSAKLKYTSYREAIDEWLEKPTTVKLSLTAAQKGTDVSVKAVVSELEKPGETVALRFVLVEDRIRFMGANGTRYQHAVVRGFLGGVKGFPVLKKDLEQTTAVNLDKLREEINKQLEDFVKGDAEPAGPRPLALKNLRVVAFIQDDASGEVLQAAQVEVEEKKE